MMRIIENGLKVKMVDTKFVTKAVDTPADLRIVEEIMKSDELYNDYK
jgi:3-deoxy-manno-octulosonate cytidylyltransferase (CMP-KDO synthetase)